MAEYKIALQGHEARYWATLAAVQGADHADAMVLAMRDRLALGIEEEEARVRKLRLERTGCACLVEHHGEQCQAMKDFQRRRYG